MWFKCTTPSWSSVMSKAWKMLIKPVLKYIAAYLSCTYLLPSLIYWCLLLLSSAILLLSVPEPFSVSSGKAPAWSARNQVPQVRHFQMFWSSWNIWLLWILHGAWGWGKERQYWKLACVTYIEGLLILWEANCNIAVGYEYLISWLGKGFLSPSNSLFQNWNLLTNIKHESEDEWWCGGLTRIYNMYEKLETPSGLFLNTLTVRHFRICLSCFCLSANWFL